MIFSGPTNSKQSHAAFLILSLLILLSGIPYINGLKAQTNNGGQLLDLLEEDPVKKDNGGQLLDLLEEDPVKFDQASQINQTGDEHWNMIYFRASYRHYYRLKVSYSDDEYGVPFNLELESETKRSVISNIYGSDNKVYLTDRLFSYLRFDYEFVQYYKHDEEEYGNTPNLDLYEAYLNYRYDNIWIRVGGLQMDLGKVDFDSPIDVLNLRYSDKTNHLDRVDTKIIMAAVVFSILEESDAWSFYWGPFQRVSEETQALRGNVGIRYQYSSEDAEIGFGIFNWFDPDNKISQEVGIDTDSGEETIEFVLEDTTIQFATIDLDVHLGDWILKSDIGMFWSKNFYHVNQYQLGDSTTDVLEMETLGLRHFAFALSLEQKMGRFFFMPLYSYRTIFDVPAKKHILQYENLEEPELEQRNLERHQVGAYMTWDWKDNLNSGFLIFYSFPFRRFGASLEIIWRPLEERSNWRFLLSHVDTAVNAMTERKTDFNRVQLTYSLQF